MTTRIGLVSDTHVPIRCRELPAALFAALEGVDLILHAGDVGELTVLDRLSELAPVIGVHGNDDSQESRQSLPYRTVVATTGTRILLWHSHYEDRQDELASRQGDAFLPKLERTARQSQEAGAAVAVFGHWHIPLVRTVDGVLLINPGAVASGNEITRQLRQTVAILETHENGGLSVRHIDLAAPDRAFEPAIDWDTGFRVALDRFSASILAPDLMARLPSFLSQISEDDQELLRPLVLRLARRCWDGEFSVIDGALLHAEIAVDPSLSAQDKDRFTRILE